MTFTVQAIGYYLKIDLVRDNRRSEGKKPMNARKIIANERGVQ